MNGRTDERVNGYAGYNQGGENVRKRKLISVAALLAVAWAGFFIHACAAGPIFYDPARVGDISDVPRVRVGLSAGLRVERILFSVSGPYAITDGRGVLESGEQLEAAVSWDGGIRVNQLVSQDPIVRVTCGRDGDLAIGGVRYHGDVLIVADEDRQTRAPRVTLVNEVDLEDYLKGVVGKEMALSAGTEALKAQVIAARTYAMYESRHRTLSEIKGEKFDLYDDERSQVYGGMERETASARRLVDETRGLFVVWDGRLFKTYYSSTCGGHTEPARLILGGEAEDIPPLGGAACAYCEGSKYYRWTEAFSKAELAKKLFPERSDIKILGLRVTKRLPGGHATEVAVRLEGASREVVMSANDGFRRKVDPRRIRSTLWEEPIQESGDKIILTGRGWGHGAGLCQVGAYRMADAGKSAGEILEHYYPQAAVRKLY
ncbi:MAG: SpoIID/LytB domain-containing protein [Planctomycetes bacterium]|nr:SpoIID/LytB domain-containing protein [Planctomycetota bacterium]